MGAFLLIVIIVGIIGYFTCSKEARVMRDVDRMIERNAEETKKRHILFDYTKNVTHFIAKKGYNEKFGARPLKRAIQKYIEDELAVRLIKGKLKENTKYLIDVQDEKIIIND